MNFVESNPFVPNQTVLNPIKDWRAADVWGYARTYWVGAIIQMAAIPFLGLARRDGTRADMTANE